MNTNITTKDLDAARFDFKGAYIETESDINLFLQRQGVSETLNCAHSEFFAELSHSHNDKFSAEVHYSNDFDKYGRDKAGQIYKSDFNLGSIDSAIRFIEKHASKLTGKQISVLNTTLSYMYGWKSYDYQDDDVILSPVFYCEYSDTIRLAPSNQCLIAFTDNDFDKPIFDIDGAAKKFNSYAEKALSNGFHDCDRKKGQDYCKRRLAWLTGQYIAKEHAGGRFCNLDMTLNKAA